MGLALGLGRVSMCKMWKSISNVAVPCSVNVIEGFIEVNKSNMSWGLEDSVTCHFICVLGLKLNAYLLRLRHLKWVAGKVAK